MKIEFALYELIPEEDRSFFGIATIFMAGGCARPGGPNCPACPLRSLCPTAFQWPGRQRLAGAGAL